MEGGLSCQTNPKSWYLFFTWTATKRSSIGKDEVIRNQESSSRRPMVESALRVTSLLKMRDPLTGTVLSLDLRIVFW